MNITTNIEIVVRFAVDAVELIRNNFDVKEEVKCNYLGSCDCPAFIRIEMMNRGVQADYLDLFDCADHGMLFDKYVTVKEENFEFDYSEASGAGKDRAKCYFKVPCEFDLLGYLNMLYKMNLESDNKILVTVYKDTVIPGSKDDDNLMDIEVDKNILTAYFKERILPSFKGDDKSISDEGLFEEWLSECTADDTDDLWAYITSQKEYYIDLYNKAYDRFLEQAKKDGSANPEDTANELFDETANAGEVVGCYLVYHGDDAYKDWMENLNFYTERSREKQEEFPPIKKAQDEEVTKILAKLCGKVVEDTASTPVADGSIKFKSGAELLLYLRDKGDLYNPVTKQYAFSYSEAGEIAVYSNISLKKAMQLATDMKEAGENGWSAFLGTGGDILSLADDTAQNWAVLNFDETGWVRADENTFDPKSDEDIEREIGEQKDAEYNAERNSRFSDDAQYAVTSYWCGEDGDTKIWLCGSKEEAIAKMKRLWEKSYNAALVDDNFDKERTYHEELLGRVAWDDELYRMFEVIQIADADDEEI